MQSAPAGTHPQSGPGRGPAARPCWSELQKMCSVSCVCPLWPHPAVPRAWTVLWLETKLSRAEQRLHASAQGILKDMFCVFSQTQAYRNIARMGQEPPHPGTAESVVDMVLYHAPNKDSLRHGQSTASQAGSLPSGHQTTLRLSGCPNSILCSNETQPGTTRGTEPCCRSRTFLGLSWTVVVLTLSRVLGPSLCTKSLRVGV